MYKTPIKKTHKIVSKPEMEQEVIVVSCQNKSFSCSLPVESGFQYCIKHILQEPKAPYKACTYTFGNGKLCGQAKIAEDSSDKK